MSDSIDSPQPPKKGSVRVRARRAKLKSGAKPSAASAFIPGSSQTKDELKIAMEAVQSERQLFRSVLDQLPCYVALLTPDYHIAFANRVFRERFGDCGSRHCYEFLFGYQEPCADCQTFKVLKTMSPRQWNWNGPDGRAYNVFDFPFTDTNGATLILEMGLDETARKAAEGELEVYRKHLEEMVEQRTAELQAAQEALRRYELLAQDSRDIILFVRRRDGRILEANQAAMRAYGYSRDELLGLSIYQLRTFGAKEMAEQMARADSVGILFEAEHTRKDGTRFPVEISSRGMAIGKERVLLSVIRDISERKAAEAALRESEASVRKKLNSILSPEAGVGELDLGDILDVPSVQSLMEDFYQLAHIPMSIIDLKGKVLVGVGWQEICAKFHRLNPESCKHCIESDTQLSAGLAAGESRLYKCKNGMWDVATPLVIAGQHVGNVFSGQFFFEGEIPDRESFRLQARRYGFDEERYLEALEAVPRLSRDALEKGMAFFMKLAQMLSRTGYNNLKLARLLSERDTLTLSLQKAQKELQAHAEELEHTVARRTARLQETVAELEHFSYAIVHDMRAPLRAMQGFADIVEQDCIGCHRGSQEYLRRIRVATVRMDQLITDSLNYSKALRQELPLDAVDLSALLHDLVDTYPNLQPDRARIELQTPLPVVLGNASALTQCFSNLLGNAAKFAKPYMTPHIKVRAEESRQCSGQEMVRIWVEDDGIGIPETLLPRVFDMFQRGSNTHEGTGIGLAIVRKVVERMGGRSGVESREGQGSQFWVELIKAS